MHFIDYICRFSTSSLLLTLQNLGSCFFPWLSVKISQIQYDQMMEVTLSQSLYVSVSYSCTCIKNVNGIIYHLHVHTCIHTGRGRWVTCTWHIKILLGEMFVHRWFFLMFTQFNNDFICSLQYSVCFKIDFRETTFNNVISLDCMIFSFQCIARHENPSSVMKSD